MGCVKWEREGFSPETLGHPGARGEAEPTPEQEC